MDGDVEKLEHFALLAGIKNSTSTVENSMERPQKMELPFAPAIPLVGTDPKGLKAGSQRYLFPHVRSSVTHSGQKVAATQVAVNDRIHKMWSRNGT